MSERTEEAFDFDLSNRQYDKITRMIDNAYEKAEFRQIGQKRHNDKANAMANGAHGTHEIMQNTGVHSWNTEHKIKGQMHIFSEYCKVNYDIKNLHGIKPDMLTSFFNEMADRGYSQKTFESYCSTLERFGVMLDKAYEAGNRSETWHEAISTAKVELKGEFVQLNVNSRAYDNPHDVVASIKDETCKLVGTLQLDYGLRLSDACKLLEIKDLGRVNHSKGGQPIELSPNVKTLLQNVTAEDCKGLKNRYQVELKSAAESCGETYTGKATHGLRHNFAQEHYQDFLSQGHTPRQALLETAELMGHHRPDITEHYLR